MIETLERQIVADPQRACRYVMIVHQRAWGLVLTYLGRHDGKVP